MLFPFSSFSVGTATGLSKEYTHVMSEVSQPLSSLRTLAATGHTDESMTGAIRTAIGSVCSAAPMEENVLMRLAHASRSRRTFIPIVSMASTRTSGPMSSMAGMVSSDTRTSMDSISMTGFMLLARSQATSALGLPTVAVVARI